MTSDAKGANRLAGETSPYLLQHAHNPVDWYPWGEEAFARARMENRPILLSVGYSACHWCHVMERESFENPAIARLMNENFVNIKVDREERPDVDHIYMNAVQMLTGRGGWPMTVFLKPTGEPFYGGTYFPPEQRHGMPGFPTVLQTIARKYNESPEDIDKAVHEITSRLRQLESIAGAKEIPGAHAVADAGRSLQRAYDETYGGIGDAPKFPNTGALDLFLRAGHVTGERHFAQMTLDTLRHMACGGIYDQLGGGFHRYSVDRRWLVPHFEKMLYDNAQLVPLYLSAFQITGDTFYSDIARDVLDYITREMHDASGGFFSTQDADSEGIEGKYFLWDHEEVVRLLGPDDAEIACRIWDVSEEGNFEGRNILHATLDDARAARVFEKGPGEIRKLLQRARRTLLAARQQRIAPDRDDKILTSWNALMISAFARAAEILDNEGYGATARRGIAFIEREMRKGDRLLATAKDGRAHLNGYLDDYVFYANALIDVYEALQDAGDLANARRVVDVVIAHFWDEREGGFFFTSDDHEALLVRSKPVFDSSTPSGNAIAAQVLLRLHHHTGDEAYRERAESVLRVIAPVAAQQPFGGASALAALDYYHSGPREICVLVERELARENPLVRAIRSTFIPNRTLTIADPDPASSRPPLLAGKEQIDGKATVYVCHRRTCSPPATTWNELAPLLGV